MPRAKAKTPPKIKPARTTYGKAHTGRKPNDARRHAVRALYDAGCSLREIAARFGVRYQAVHGMLQRMGAPLRPRGGNTGGHSRHKK